MPERQKTTLSTAGYQKISDWCILADEEDATMLRQAKTEIQNCWWHEGYIDDIIIPYFLTSNRRTVIDVGASYGWMAVSFAKYFDEVKCFEIREDVRHALRENISRFSNVEVFDCGLSDSKKKVKLSHRPNTGTSVINRKRVLEEQSPEYPKGDDILGSAVEVPEGSLVNTLDSYNFNNVDCIKLDIEDHEYFALFGAMETIKKWKPVLIVEIRFSKKRHFRYFKPRQRIFKLLHSLDYQIVDVRGGDFIFTHKNQDPYNGLDL
ncbi:hypothetical protein CMI37_38820 [Candidatus Pacearchaeota archaeon]|nr:hypothetical protein [Candidatus Pacearchaeota archaeon]|tara:strand:- start:1418 stop:2209 length:792 start_codon:yes stop_codon:yes gene_type:complete